MLRRFIRNEDGWIGITGPIWTLIFVVLAGIALDPSNAFLAKNRLAAATDAAALAAAMDLPDVDKARATALEYLEKNMPAERYGAITTTTDVVTGTWDSATRTFQASDQSPTAIQLVARHSNLPEYASGVPQLVMGMFGANDWQMSNSSVAMTTSGCVQESLLGGLSEYLFYFDDPSSDGNWQGASKGFEGDVAVNGIGADLRTSGDVPYAGTIYTNGGSLGAWQDIVDDNSATASTVFGEVSRIDALRSDLQTAFDYIDAMPVTPGFDNLTAADLIGLNTQDGVGTTYVINVTSDLKSSDPIDVTGDADDLFIVRWDDDPSTPGYQGQVKFSGGGGFNPLGNLMPTNFINVAGDLNASGGGSTPSGLIQYLDNLPNEVGGGGFFTGYWLTTGKSDKYETSSFSNAIFVGGWYTTTIKFSMTSGTSGAYVSPAPAGLMMGCSASGTVMGGILVD